MCSWFCGTFCCFLLRCRDSCNQSSSTSVSNGNRGSDFHLSSIPRGLEDHQEHSTSGQNTITEGGNAIGSQPSLRPAMPRMGISSADPRNKPLPAIRTTFDGGGPGASRRGKIISHLELYRPNGSSATCAHNIIEDGPAGDIGLHSVSTSVLPPRSTSFRLKCYLKRR